MIELVMLELSAELAARARAEAAATNRRFEEVVSEWLGRGAAETFEADVSDAALLARCDAELPSSTQRELSDLLARNRESQLSASERLRLDNILASYRHGLLLKAKAWQQAVTRGLKPPLTDSAA